MVSSGAVLENRYIVKRELGKGGEGAVYEAEDQRLGKTVALKEIFSAQEWARNVFEVQARLLAKLEHPALPIVTDFFTNLDGQFLVMQYIPGPDLAAMLEKKSGLLSVDNVLRWADQLLDVLDYLHTYPQPIIHRDIKPQNLKINKRGQIMLLDFGLAKDMTVGTIVRGLTPDYSPPEQVQFKSTDARSDLYALAATLYHLLTGVLPPNAAKRETLAPDPLRLANEINPDVPVGVAEILMQAMALDMNKRMTRATEMREKLKSVKESLPLTDPVASTASEKNAAPAPSPDKRELFIIRVAPLYGALGNYHLRSLLVGERLIIKGEQGNYYQVFAQTGEEGWVERPYISLNDPKSYFNLTAGSKTVKGFLRGAGRFSDDLNIVLLEEEFGADLTIPIKDILRMSIQWPRVRATLRDQTKISGQFKFQGSFIFGENHKIREGYGTTLDLTSMKVRIELEAIEPFQQRKP